MSADDEALRTRKALEATPRITLDDNVRQLRPGPFAGDDLDLTDAQLVDEAARVTLLRDHLATYSHLDPAVVLAGPDTALARRRFATLGGIPVTVLDELPGGADVMLAYSIPPLENPDPPRKAHG